MKKAKIALIALLLAGMFSCSEELTSEDKLISTPEASKDADASILAACNITGCSLVPPGCTNTYTYVSDFSSVVTTWNVVSGDITLLSGQGTSQATFQFGSGFSTGAIQASGEGSGFCASTFYISAVPTPVITAVRNSDPGEPTDYKFTATAIAGATYYWYVSGSLQEVTTSNEFYWYFPCNDTERITCRVSVCGSCQSPVSNGITKTGGCIRT